MRTTKPRTTLDNNGDGSKEDLSGFSSLKKSSSGPSKGKTKRVISSSSAVSHASLWGDLSRKSVRSLFKAYLAGLTSAKPYYRNVRALHWYSGLRGERRRAIISRLREVDPVGAGTLIARLRGLKKHANSVRRNLIESKFKPAKKEIAQMGVMVQQEQLETAGASVLRFVPMGGMKKALSLVRAAGYTPDETAAIFNMKPDDVNSLATPDDIKGARREMPEAVRIAADGYVLRDLMKGVVTPLTEIADRISARRTKLVLDMSAEQRALVKEDKVLEDKREEDMAGRFGVDRKKGEVIEVKAVKERKVK